MFPSCTHIFLSLLPFYGNTLLLLNVNYVLSFLNVVYTDAKVF